MKPKNQLITMSAVCATFATAPVLQADEPAVDARLRALEHELMSLRQELSAEKAANARAALQRPTDFVAGEYVAPAVVEDPVDRDEIFVQTKQSPVTELKLRGRMHYQFGYANADDYSDFHTFEWRRVRLGVEGKLLDDWSFSIMSNILPELTQNYLHSAYIKYNGFDWTTISFEKERPRFGAELKTSSSKIKTVERSLLSNRLDPGQTTGLALYGDVGLFNWQVGAYNGEIGDQRSSEITDLGNPGVPEYLFNASIGVDLSEPLGVDELSVRLDYMNNQDDDGLTGLFLAEEAWAASVAFSHGRFSLLAEYAHADFHTGGDLNGFYLIPSFMLTDKLEAVMRYEYIQADGGIGLGHQSRYARRVVASDPDVPIGASVRGEDYWAVYGGLNYYINKSVKFMFGVEYAELDDIIGGGSSMDVFSGFGAVRLEF